MDSRRHRITTGSNTFHFSDGWIVMPTRRRDATIPIDSSTRIASRATLRETPCSALTPSSVSTCPAGYVPDAIPVPSAVSRLRCSALTFDGEVTYTSCHTFADHKLEQIFW